MGALVDSTSTGDDAESEVEEHPEASFAVDVAPGDPADKSLFNTLRPGIVPIACFRLGDNRYEFDSSFIVPEAKPDLVKLGEMRVDYKDSPASIFGHADPVGTDTYNKTLSGNRARAFHALLTRDTDAWEALFNEHGWGLKSTQRILAFLEAEAAADAAASEPDSGAPSDGDAAPADASGDSSTSDDAADDGEEGSFPVDGRDSKEWREAVERFQTDEGLGVDGIAGKETRKRLYEKYMAALCVDASGEEYKFEPTDFLGKGKDKKGKAAFQGCSEFNPILIMSEDESKLLEQDKEARNVRNAPNRRVVLYFFAPGLEVNVDKWPCPRASEGSAGCKKRFWSDHERRRKPDSLLTRKYARLPGDPVEGTRDTFACRFYDRLARHSPCEAGFDEWIVQLYFEPPKEAPEAGAAPAPAEGSGEATSKKGGKFSERKRVAGASFTAVTKSDGKTKKGSTNADGLLRLRARVEEDDIEIELKIPLEEPQGEAQGSSAAADGGAPAADASSGDQAKEAPRRFGTVRLTLKGGKLAELHDAEQVDAARKDRLLNLGFGPTDRTKWDADPKVLSDALAALAKQEEVPEVDDDKLREIYGS
ncbi:MAG: peptidoglycan-binding protein [Myxococcota bacterium]